MGISKIFLESIRSVYDFLNDKAGEHYSLEEIVEGVHSDIETVKKQLEELRKMHAIRYKKGKFYCPAILKINQK